MDPATTGMRGRPNVNLGVNAGFLSIKPDQNGSFPLLVWHTYRHKNELFPFNAKADAQFDSSMPTYNYQYPPKLAAPSANFHLFNNLDETSEIGLCQMFAHNTIRIAYEAKVNRALFEYANHNQLTKRDANGNYSALNTATQNTINNACRHGVYHAKGTACGNIISHNVDMADPIVTPQDSTFYRALESAVTILPLKIAGAFGFTATMLILSASILSAVKRIGVG